MRSKNSYGFPATVFWLVAVLLLCAGMRAAYLHYYRAAYPVRYLDTVESFAAESSLPPELVFAVIRSESGFDSNAVSHVEARGLMQITEDTFKWARWRMGDAPERGFDEMFIPEINIRYGAAILRLLLDEFEGEREALSAYHAGWGSVKGWLEDAKYSSDGKTLTVIPFLNTRAYVDKVLDTRDTYRMLYDFEDAKQLLS